MRASLGPAAPTGRTLPLGWLPATVLIALLPAVSPAARAEDSGCTSLLIDGPRYGHFSQVWVKSGDLTDDERKGALDHWNGCSSSNTSFPELVMNDPAGGEHYVVTIEVQELNSAGNGHCGEFDGTNTLKIFRFTEKSGKTLSCGDISQTAAHELGHWLGLADAPFTSTCENFVMSEITPNNQNTRSVQPKECEKVGGKWSMKAECDSANPPADGCLDDPIADLPDLCDLAPILCEDPDWGGDPLPWWTITETSPDRKCESDWDLTCGSTGCEGTLTESCFFVVSGVVPKGLAPKSTTSHVGPVTGLDAPTDGQLVGGVINVSGWAADPEYGVHTVAFWVDDQPVGLSGYTYGLSRSDVCQQVADPNCPYVGFSGDLDTRGLSDGNHLLKVVSAESRLSKPGPSYYDVPIVVDNRKPSLSLSSPASGSKVSGTTTISVSASDASGIQKVRFRVDGEWPATCVDTTAPYTCSWDTTAYADGSHSVKIQAIDEAWNIRSITPTYVVDNTVPKMFVDRPSHQQVVYGTSVRLFGWALDASSIASYSFKLDGSPLPLNGPVTSVHRQDVCNAFPEILDPRCPYVGWSTYFDSTAYSNGGHTLTVTVTDGAGQTRSFNRSFIIDNPPVVLEFQPVADAYALQAWPSSNYGGSSYLAVRTTSDGNGAYSFLKFQVSGVEGPVVSARLEVRTASDMNELFLYWLQHSNWYEYSLNWTNFPGPGGLLDNRYGLSSNVWYSFDVSAYVTGNGTYSLGFAGDNPVWTYLRSRESPYPPRLVVSYEP